MSQPQSEPMRYLREATAGLKEATRRLDEHVIEHRELFEWVTAVADHARAVEAAVRGLEARLNGGLG